MNNRELDRVLRERLENFELDPPMYVWDKIAAARDARRRFRPWVLWGGGLALLALTASVGLWLLQGATSMKPDARELTVHSGNVTAPVAQKPASDATPLPEPSPAPRERGTTVAFGNNVSDENTSSPSVVSGMAPALEFPDASVQRVASFEMLRGPGLKWIEREVPRGGFPEKSCFGFTKERWQLHFNLDVVASPEYVFRDLRPRSKEFADYAGSRDKMEDIRGGFTAGVRLSAVTDFGLSLRTGIQYAQINEVLNFRDPNEIKTIVTIVYDEDGNIIGTDTSYTAGTRLVVTYNRHRMVDVPLMAGYEFQFPRFSMAVHGGVYFNLLFSQKGKILGPDGKPVPVSSELRHPYPAFRDNLGMSLAGSIGFNYRLTPEVQFILEPQFRLILDPVTRADYPLKQDYFLTGVTLGIRKNL